MLKFSACVTTQMCQSLVVNASLADLHVRYQLNFLCIVEYNQKSLYYNLYCGVYIGNIPKDFPTLSLYEFTLILALFNTNVDDLVHKL